VSLNLSQPYGSPWPVTGISLLTCFTRRIWEDKLIETDIEEIGYESVDWIRMVVNKDR
jgi:hypothetical protein